MEKKYIMLVGAPGSGKTVLREKIISRENNKNIKVISPDDIRVDLFGSKLDITEEKQMKTFEKIEELEKIYAKDAETDIIIYDATNTSSKRRKQTYNRIKAFNKNVFVEIHFCYEPIQVLIKRNKLRDAENSVPTDVVERMYRASSPPRVKVDCDVFFFHSTTKMFEKKLNIQEVKSLDELFLYFTKEYKKELEGVYASHNSDYHLESIDEHIEMCTKESVSRKDPFLTIISLFHDLGKGQTRCPNKKNPDRSSFFLHENVSAIYLLACIHELNDPYLNENKSELIEVVRKHMAAHQGITDKMVKRNLLTEKEVKKLKEFCLIDEKSRIV